MKNFIEKLLSYFGYHKESFTNVPLTPPVNKPKRKPAIKKATTRKTTIKK